MAPSSGPFRVCPTEEALRSFHARELPSAEDGRVRSHLAGCPACAARDAVLVREHETWVDRLRAAGPPPDKPAGAGPRPAEAAWSVDTIPGYEIRAELGRGGQGVVLRAWQKSTKREVALKVLREGADASPAARGRFEREIELVARLNHAHIVTVFDSGRTADGRRYLVMDYVRGRRLDGWLAEAGPALRERLRLFGKLCHAVNYAHQRGVLHRDLKPSNVLVDDAGEPHILDFGLARTLTERGLHTLTLPQEVAGTLPYLSPEQARGLPDAVDVRGDVYALGVMLYELLTGSAPYPVDGSMLDVLRHIAETPPARLRGRGPQRFDDELETIVLKALAKERERRYQTAGELGGDIDHYLAHEPIAAKRDSGLYLLRKTLQRYRIAVAVSVAFVLLAAGAATALGVMYDRQAGLAGEAQRQAQAAEAARAQAAGRLQQVRELARYFVLEFDPLIRQLPGAGPARKALVEKGLAYLGQLAREAGESVEPRLELAGAYVTIGDVQGDLAAASLGDLQGALASYGQAETLLNAVLERDPQDRRAVRMWLLNRIKLGDALLATGSADRALDCYTEVRDRGESWLAVREEDPPVRSDLVSARLRIGNVRLMRGELDAAQAEFEHYLADCRAAVERAPEDVWVLRSVGVGLTKLAALHYQRRALEPALAQYQEFLEICERVRAAEPDNLVARRDLAIAHQWLGILHADLGRAGPALASFDASDGGLEALLAEDPRDSVAGHLLATNLSKRGEIHLAAGRADEARAAFVRSAELTAELAGRHPDRVDVVRLLGVAYYKLAELERAAAADTGRSALERSAHWQSARAWLERAQAVFVDMQTRGILAASDAGVPEELAGEMAQCEREITGLAESATGAAAAPRPPV